MTEASCSKVTLGEGMQGSMLTLGVAFSNMRETVVSFFAVDTKTAELSSEDGVLNDAEISKILGRLGHKTKKGPSVNVIPPVHFGDVGILTPKATKAAARVWMEKHGKRYYDTDSGKMDVVKIGNHTSGYTQKYQIYDAKKNRM